MTFCNSVHAFPPHCHSNPPKKPNWLHGKGMRTSGGNIFSEGFVRVKSKWIPDNMKDMNNVNIELASVYSPEFRKGGVRKYLVDKIFF